MSTQAQHQPDVHNGKQNNPKMYPGIYQRVSNEHHNLHAASPNTLLEFVMETYKFPLDCLLPTRKLPDGLMSTRKYKQVVSSIN